MVDYEQLIDRTDIWSILQDRLPIDDMLADLFYVYGRKLAQHNNILIDR